MQLLKKKKEGRELNANKPIFRLVSGNNNFKTNSKT